MEAPPIPTPPTDTGDPGITDDEILFGQSAAFTGPIAALGEAMNLGIEAAFHEANQAGGVHGRNLRLVARDDGYEPAGAFFNTQWLIENVKVFGLIGEVGTPTSRAALPLARAAGVPFIAPLTGAQLLRADELTNVLNLRASYHQETAKIVDLLADAGVSRVAVMYQNDSYGIDGFTGVRNALNSRNDMDLVGSWYYKRNTDAVQGAVFRIADANPDAVIIIGAHRPAAEAIKKLRAKWERTPSSSMCLSWAATRLPMTLAMRGKVFYVTQVVPLPGGDDFQALSEYRAALSAYNAANNMSESPGFVSLEGYLAGRLAIERLRRLRCGCQSEVLPRRGRFNDRHRRHSAAVRE